MKKITVDDLRKFFVGWLDNTTTYPDEILTKYINVAYSGSYNLGSCLPEEERELLIYILIAHIIVQYDKVRGAYVDGAYVGYAKSNTVDIFSWTSSLSDEITSKPIFSQFLQTKYGGMYLERVYPCLLAGSFSVAGGVRGRDGSEGRFGI